MPEARNLLALAHGRQEMTEKLLAWETRQEWKLGSRGGEMFPSASQRLNNEIK